jgi:hypothetical protein
VKTTRLLRIASVSLAAVMIGVGTATPQTAGEKLEISAFAVNMSNIVTGTNAVVEITVTRWSTAAEREHLIKTMVEKDSNTLLRELQKTKATGRIRIPAAKRPDPHHLALGLDLHYAWQAPLPEGGRRIVLATDRYIGFEEARRNTRTMDYPFMLIEIRVDKDGKGVGKMAVATKISFDKEKKQLELENYSSEPVRLNNVMAKVKS